MNRVDFLVASTFDGKGFTAATKSAQELDKQQQKVKKSGAELADTVGRVSTTLARSVGVFGLSSTSLRALDDAADIAELGLTKVAGGFKQAATAATVFQMAMLGPLAAAAALGAGIGTLLMKLSGFRAEMDKTAKLVYSFFTGRETTALSGFGKGERSEFAAGALSAQQKALQAYVAQGKSIGEIKKLLPGLSDDMLKAADAQIEAGKAADQHREAIDRLASSLSGADLAKQLSDMAEALARGITLTESGKKQISETVGKALLDGLVIPPPLMAVHQEVMSKQLEEIIKGAIDRTVDKEVFAQAADDLWKKVLGGGLEGGIGETTAIKKMVDDTTERIKVMGEEAKKAAEAAAERTKAWGDALHRVAEIASMFSQMWGDIGHSIAGIFDDIASGATKFEAIAAAVGRIGDVLSGAGHSKLGGVLSGAASGALAGSKIPGVGPWGAIVGGFLGALGGLFGSGKKKAEELKKKQQEAIDAFADLYQQWVQARQELTVKGAEGATSLIDSMFEGGKFNEAFTSAANAAEYVFASFNALRASGLSTAEALAKLRPALDAMAKDAKKFAGTAAAPLIQMAKFAAENEKLLQFQAGLADLAVGLAAVGQFTQDLANKMSVDLGKSIDSMVAKGLTYEQALGLSADSLFKLQQAAAQGQVTLDAHTQKMIDDAAAAGLFEGLQDPMQKLIELQGAMVAAMGVLIQLMGGAVPAAIQRMIDEFNNAQINVNVNVDIPAGGTESGGGSEPAPPIPNFQHGGFLPERSHGTLARVAERGTGGEYMIPANLMGALGDNVTINVYALPHQDPREIAEDTNREFRLNRRGRYSQSKRGRR